VLVLLPFELILLECNQFLALLLQALFEVEHFGVVLLLEVVCTLEVVLLDFILDLHLDFLEGFGTLHLLQLGTDLFEH